MGSSYSRDAVWITILAVSDTEFEDDVAGDRVDIVPDDVIERTADSRGRVRIGPQYAGNHIRVGVLRVAD